MEPFELSATQALDALAKREISSRELVQSSIQRIEETRLINAVCTSIPDLALKAAETSDRKRSSGATLGRLEGLPVLHKDLIDTAGIRTTYGSAAFKDHVPQTDAEVVSRIANAGAITLGKTNTPQFGTGGHTHNEVFGTTLNPFDLSKSAGGSSGGSASALGAQVVSLATGTDMAGSLRIPSSFCGTVGLRPSPGMVPWRPTKMAWFPFVAAGPMARNVDDLALLMSVMAGHDPRTVISFSGSGEIFADLSKHAPKKWRVAWAPQIAGLPVDEEVLLKLAEVLEVLKSMDVELTEAEPDLSDAHEAFMVWRTWYYATQYGELLKASPMVLDEATASNTEAGLKLTSEQLGNAEHKRSRLHDSTVKFFDDFDILITPCTPTTAFDATEKWPRKVAGQEMNSYLDWMRHLYYLTAAGVPALSLPVGLGTSGLPVGIQIVSAPRRDLDVLLFAKQLEKYIGPLPHTPIF